MLYRNLIRKYYSEAGDDGADAGGSGATTKTYTEAEVAELVAGLKQNNAQLLAEKKETARQKKEADDARMLAEQERAKKSGELEQFEQALRSSFEKEKGELSSKLEALSARVVGESKKAVLGGFATEFLTPESLDIIAQLVKVEFDGNDVKTQFTDFAGKVVTTDPVEFKKWMAKHPAISHLMRSTLSSGGGASGSKSSGGATDFASMSLTEKSRLANENPKLYAQLSAKN